MEIIMNEYKYAESLANKTDLKIDDLGTKPSFTIRVLAMYYRENGKDDDTIIRLVLDYIQRCLKDGYKESRWIESVYRQVRFTKKYKCKRIDEISITKSEIDTIQAVKGKAKQKVLFTILVLAKFYNAVFDKNNNWVNSKCSKIFKLANVQLTREKQGLLINDFYQDNLVKVGKTVGKFNLQVNFVNDNSETVMTITRLNDLGNEYLLYCGENYKRCERCGNIVKQSRNGKTRYCENCSKIVNREKTKERMSKLRKTQNV